MKENDGNAIRQKRLRESFFLLSSFLALALIVRLYLISSGPTARHGNDEFAPVLPRHTYRATIPDNDAFETVLLNKNTALNTAAWQDILHARVHLVHLQIRTPAVIHNEDGYTGVEGIFCRIDWDLHKKNPAPVAAFRVLMAQSTDCQNRRIQVDLSLAVRRIQQFEQGETPGSVKTLELAGVVFHESRCGSTLVANLLASMNPAQHRVYSESRPPLLAINACAAQSSSSSSSDCSPALAAQILRDAIHLMSRSDDPAEQRVFFKFQSLATHQIALFQQAFPTTPWIFVYREPVQVLASYLNKAGKHKRNAKCALKQFHGPPRKVKELVEKLKGGPRIKDMTPVEYCAAHLASLTETAATALQADDSHGRAVNYHSLPDRLWEAVLPQHWDITPTTTEIDRMTACAGQYSKGMHGKTGPFQDDSRQKDETASPKLRQAAQQYLAESYKVLEALAT